MDSVSESNAAAALALKARREVPATLNITFLSTNLIGNVLRNWRVATALAGAEDRLESASAGPLESCIPTTK